MAHLRRLERRGSLATRVAKPSNKDIVACFMAVITLVVIEGLAKPAEGWWYGGQQVQAEQQERA